MSDSSPSNTEPKVIPWQIAVFAQYGFGFAGSALFFGTDHPDIVHVVLLGTLFCFFAILALIATVSQQAWGGLIIVLSGFPIFFLLLALGQWLA